MTRSARLAFALAVTMVVGLLGGTSGSGTAGPVPTHAVTRVIVQATEDLGATASAVVARGGRVLDVISPLGMVVADVPDEALASIEADAATASVTEDVPLQVQSADTTSTEQAIAAATASDPTAGAGVGIVMVDTGIADHADLDDRVVARYDLATGRRGTGQALDAHGHGTFLAGVAAGDGGVAPGAHLVSVRVADADGSTTLARVLHGLAVADVARTQHDAPVVVLALAGDPGDSPDPLMITLEMLWARGSTVVVPSGNRGEDGVVTSPGTDPYLITAGAVDDDGAVPAWSGRGTPFGHAKPEVHAPGVAVVGPRVPGSTISDATPVDDAIGPDHLRGSGTSMAAAHVAGQAAAILATEPHLTPTEVKGRLMGAPANADLAPLPEATNSDRGHARVTAPGQLRRTADGLQPAGWTWAGWTWAGWTWAGWTWAGDADASGDEWAGWTWAHGEWTGWTWAGWTWADNEWAGWTWAGWTWAGWTWAAADWGTPS